MRAAWRGLRALLCLTALFSLLCAPVPVQAEALDARPLKIGLLPTSPPLSLLRLYDPLRVYLARHLDRPVELYTSRGFYESFQDLSSGEFDILITAPHYGVVAMDHGYIPLARYSVRLHPMIAVPKGSPMTEAAQLRGHTILTANRMAAMSVVAEFWLNRALGLKANRDYMLEEALNHGTAIRRVAMGDAAAAITSNSVITQLSPDIRQRIDVFELDLTIPHQFTLAHPRLGPQRIEAIRTALLGFEHTESGRRFFEASGFGGFQPLTPQDIDEARPYSAMIAKMIEAQP